MTGGVYPPPANDEPEVLREPALSNALAQAPDHADLPDWRTRKAILDHAHDAVAASQELMAAGRAASPWWTLDWWLRRATSRAHTPWNAAFATVLVAVLATLMWHREPVPDARLDQKPGVAAPSPKTEQAQGGDTNRMASEATPTGQAAPAAAAASEGGSTALQDMNRRGGDESRALPPEPPPTPLAESRASAQLPVAPPAPSASPAPSPAAPPAAAQPGEEASALRKSRSQSAQPASASPAPATAPSAASGQSAADAARTASASDAPARSRSAESAARSAAPADAAGAPRYSAQGAAPSSKVRTDETPPPSFASLAQWTEMRVANISGDVRVLSRAEGGELNLLLNSAAIMATSPQPLKVLPDWRVSLEKKGAVLSVLELARNQVRWTEGGSPPATGVPPPGAVDALRAALGEAVKTAPTKPSATSRRPSHKESADAPPPAAPPGDAPAEPSRP